ncbi:ABC transporter substrate-binding protein [Neptuniibacter sp. QD57_21]|uniref:ABC transporter substrate-binding protein n=1 Tax=Neptuniibacter sp. QD57_21 TaxID=3398213 RepID=UPI0039F48E7B
MAVIIKLSYLLCTMLLLFSLSSSQTFADGKKQVLVIESYHASFKWDADYRRAIQDTLQDYATIKFFEMDTKRLPPNLHPKQAEAAWDRYLKSEPDLVILGDDNALKFLGPKFARKQTPVVYLGINNNPRNYFEYTFLPKHISGVLERPLMKRSVMYLQEMTEKPMEKVLILFDTGTTSKTIAKEVFQDKNKLRIGSATVHVKFIAEQNQWQEAILQASDQKFDAIILGLYHTITDAKGVHVPSKNIIKWTSKNSMLPIFAFWEFSVGKDMAIGGLVLDGYSQGKAAATIALRTLQNEEDQRSEPVISNQGQFVFSRSQLKKWNIQLPTHLQDKAIYLP